MTRLPPLVHYPGWGQAAGGRAIGSLRRPALLMALLVLGGCGTGAPAPREVRFWAMGREGEAVRRLVPAFERRHPDIRVRVQQIPWSAAHEKLLTAFVGEVMPDVYQLGSTWLPELAAIGAAAPLDARLAGSPVGADDFAAVLDANRIDGRTYGVPWYVDTRLLFYRTDLLAEAGYAAPLDDWATWVGAMLGVRAALGPERYALLMPIREWQPLVIFALQRGAGLLRDGDRYGDFQSPAFREAFAFYLDLFRRRLAPARAEAQVTNVYQDFASGFFAFYITGPWNIGEFQERLPAAMAGRWGTMPMPAPRAPGPGLSIAGGASLAMSPGARDPEAAWQWIAYLSDPAVQVELYRLTGDLPARRSAWRDPALADNVHAQAFWAQLQHVRAVPSIPEWERIAARIADYADAAVRGALTPDEALAALDRDVDAILAKRRWLLDRRAAAAPRT